MYLDFCSGCLILLKFKQIVGIDNNQRIDLELNDNIYLITLSHGITMTS